MNTGDGGGPGPDAALPPPDDSAELYDQGNLPRFAIDLPPASVAALEADPFAYAPGTLHYGAESVANIGVRLKGEWNFRPLSAKASFKLHFDEYVPGQTFRGLRHMNLNNALEDPSFIAERMVYATFRAAGLPAPRCNNAVVTVNGELYGVYVNVETEDKTFLRRWFASDDGNIYEEAGVDFTVGSETTWELETNETVNDRSDLIALIAAIDAASDDTLLEDLAGVLDTTRFLRYCALEGIVNQWDGYAYTHYGPNNFRVYAEPGGGLFNLIPWGMDMAMKPVDGQTYVPIYDARGMLLQRCLAGASCRAAYEATVREMTDLFEAQGFPAIVDTYRAQILADVLADPRREVDQFTYDTFHGIVRDFVTERPASVRAELP